MLISKHLVGSLKCNSCSRKMAAMATSVGFTYSLKACGSICLWEHSCCQLLLVGDDQGWWQEPTLLSHLIEVMILVITTNVSQHPAHPHTAIAEDLSNLHCVALLWGRNCLGGTQQGLHSPSRATSSYVGLFCMVNNSERGNARVELGIVQAKCMGLLKCSQVCTCLHHFSGCSTVIAN